ncbi:MAG: tetratricopeptide repeat protein [Anaerolineales bacterium]|nr:tetratricopeptide repeat protein [Anaerolineales bacterium]
MMQIQDRQIVQGSSAQIDSLNQQAWALLSTDRQQALALSVQARDLATTGEFAEAAYKKGLAESLRTIGRVYLYDGRYDQALATALEALAIAEEVGAQAFLPRILHTLGSSCHMLGDLSDGLTYFLRQLEVSEALGDQEGQASALLGIGILHADSENYDSALTYYQKALALLRDSGETYWTALLLNNISYTYVCMGSYEQALASGLESRAVSREHGHQRVAAIACSSVAEAHLNLGHEAEALQFLQEAQTWARETGQPDLEVDTLKLAGQVYGRMGDAEAAIAALQQAVARAEATKIKKQLYECHALLAEVYKAQGAFEAALRHYEQFHTVKETVFSEESDRRIKSLEVIHRTQAAQKEVQLYASLYEQEQARRLLSETLQRVGAVLASTLELETVLIQILEQLETLVPYDRASLLLRKEDYLEFKALRGFPDAQAYERQRVPLVPSRSDDVFYIIYETQQPLALEKLAAYPGWRQMGDLSIPEAWLGVPLLRDGEVAGMLSLVRDTAVPFDEESISVARTFANQAVIALTNAQLYDYVKRFNEQLEYEVRNRTEALREAYGRLERLDQAKSDFIRVTAHELRTPITVLKGYGQLLHKSVDLMNSERYARLIAGIVAGADRLSSIVNTMLLMVKIDSNELKIYPEPQVILEIVGEIAADLAGDIAERQQTVVLDESLYTLPLVPADEATLGIVFRNLILNAIKYTPDGGEIRVSGRAWAQLPPEPRYADWPAPGVELVVADNGIGIAPDALHVIFDKFYRTGTSANHSSGQTKFKGGGPGLGLTIARGIVAAHHGLIWAESAGYDEARCPGSQFHVVLPLAAAADTQ